MLTGYKNLTCGLIGKTLGHSFSPVIHGKLADYAYNLYPMEEEAVLPFLQSDAFSGLNVTIPYKQTVIPALSAMSPAAKRIGAVNTIVRRDGRLYGDNTDYSGFLYMLRRTGVSVKGKKALVFGSGGASKTAVAVLCDEGATPVVVVSRSGEDNYGNLERHADAAVLVNATPVGMYPHNGDTLVSLNLFPHCEAVLDLIYNPAATRLIYDAKTKHIPCENGLSMLVAQAKAAAELFTDEKIPDAETEKILAQVRGEKENILLLGMPGCGKSTIGRRLSERLGRPFFDTDAEVVKLAGKPIPEIFREDGEEVFRRFEHEAVKICGAKTGAVIATGGGVVTRPENEYYLRQNGKTVFLARDIATLSRDGRPLSENGDLMLMYRNRLPLYRCFSDLEVPVGGDPDTTASRIEEAWKK